MLRPRDPTELPNDRRVRVEGAVGSVDGAGGAPVAAVDAERVTTIPAPTEPRVEIDSTCKWFAMWYAGRSSSGVTTGRSALPS